MNKRLLLVFSMVFALAGILGNADAQIRENSAEFSLMGGMSMFEYSYLEMAPTYGLRAGYNFNRNWALEFGGEFMQSEFDGKRAANKGNDGEARFFHANLLYHFGKGKVVPYLSLGGGAVKFYDETARFDESMGMTRAAVGFKAFMHKNVAFRFEVAHLLAFDEQWYNDRLNIGQAFVGLSFQLGGKPIDADKDRVPDEKDECPDTPANAVVDDKGCPLDSDGDGVFDGLDACSGTPKGAIVDDTGCAGDDDQDGVKNGIDACPETPEDERNDVDEKGCTKDTDGDGVRDGLDQCPDTKKGIAVDEKGCALDEDKDGVPDTLDECPGTPEGVPVDDKGCPLDSDGDGVNDDKDECPNTREGVAVDEKGCEVITKQWVLKGINFESGKEAITADSFQNLDYAVDILRANEDVKVEIQGHTDSQGSAGYNRRLSQKRATAVMNYMIEKGIDASRLTAKGYGEDKPVADNSTEEGRAQNRRVEFKRR